MHAFVNSMFEKSGCLGEILVVHFDNKFYALSRRRTTDFSSFGGDLDKQAGTEILLKELYEFHPFEMIDFLKFLGMITPGKVYDSSTK